MTTKLILTSYDGWRHMISLVRLIDVSWVSVVPYI
jgi:hypothetical protein